MRLNIAEEQLLLPDELCFCVEVGAPDILLRVPAAMHCCFIDRAINQVLLINSHQNVDLVWLAAHHLVNFTILSVLQPLLSHCQLNFRPNSFVVFRHIFFCRPIQFKPYHFQVALVGSLIKLAHFFLPQPHRSFPVAEGTHFLLLAIDFVIHGSVGFKNGFEILFNANNGVDEHGKASAQFQN